MSGSPAPVEQPAPAPPAVAQNTETPEHMIPKSRFDEVNTKLQQLQKEQQDREAKERAETEKRAREQGQFAELLETRTKELDDLKPQLTSTQERLSAMEQLLESELKDRVKALPEEIRAMQPDGDVLVRRAWLVKAESAAAKLQTVRSPGTPPGPRGSGAQTSPGTTSDDLVARKKASGIYG